MLDDSNKEDQSGEVISQTSNTARRGRAFETADAALAAWRTVE